MMIQPPRQRDHLRPEGAAVLLILVAVGLAVAVALVFVFVVRV